MIELKKPGGLDIRTPAAMGGAAASTARNYARRRPASWVHAQELLLERWAMHQKARGLEDATGLTYVEDHIYPVNGRTVSGLTVPANLQRVSRLDNARKSARMPASEAHELWSLEEAYELAHPAARRGYHEGVCPDRLRECSRVADADADSRCPAVIV